MVEMIGELIAGEHAYATDDGIYLSVETIDGYGLLAHQSLDDMRSQESAGAGYQNFHAGTSGYTCSKIRSIIDETRSISS